MRNIWLGWCMVGYVGTKKRETLPMVGSIYLVLSSCAQVDDTIKTFKKTRIIIALIFSDSFYFEIHRTPLLSLQLY